MHCSKCGKQIHDNEEAEFDTTNVASGPGGRRAYTTTAPIWLCPECAAYRRTTIHLTYWVVGVVLTIAAFLAVIGLLASR